MRSLFNKGLDEDGNSANFVESETILAIDDKCFSHVQIRGSAPILWE